MGLISVDREKSAGGYVLIAPQTADGKVFLVEAISGDIAHEWKLPVRPGRHAVLLPNGNLGYNGNHANSFNRYAPWSMWHGGDFYEVSPENRILWHYEDPDHHHDAQWLPNGNILYSACEKASPSFAARIQGGTPSYQNDNMWIDVIKEVDREGTVLWQWKASEHLDPKDFPIHPGFGRTNWPLINGLDITDNGATVLMSLRVTSGIIGVNKKSGVVNLHIPPGPLSHQHAPVPLSNGNILAFDNGNFRPGAHVPFSRIVEINTSDNTLAWSYADEHVSAFFSPYMGNAQPLPNGNVHITDSTSGRLFEVTREGEVVWEYVIPWFNCYPDVEARKTGPGRVNTVFKTYRYSPEEIPWLKRN